MPRLGVGVLPTSLGARRGIQCQPEGAPEDLAGHAYDAIHSR